MKKETFLTRKRELEKEYNDKVKALKIEYANSNNPYKIGDIIEARTGKIRIEKIWGSQSMLSEYPECIYSGPRLTKAGREFKSGEKMNVYQSNVIKREECEIKNRILTLTFPKT